MIAQDCLGLLPVQATLAGFQQLNHSVAARPGVRLQAGGRDSLAGTTADVFALIVIGAADDVLALNQPKGAWHSLHQPDFPAGIGQKENKATRNRSTTEKSDRLLTVAAGQDSSDQ